MSEAIAFDTHRFVKHLTENGFTEQVSLLNSNLATQADIVAIQRDIAEVKSDLLKWMVGALIAQGGVIVTLLKLLPG